MTTSHSAPRSSRPSTGVDLVVGDAQQLDQLRAQARRAARADLDAHDLAEAPPAQLVLDGLQQVGGVVGHLQVGVARHPEDVALDDLHAREERIEMVGDHVLERDQHGLALDRRAQPVAPEHEKPGQDLSRDLDAREHGLIGDRVAHEHREAERQVGDVRERPARRDRERRQRGEDHALEVPGQLRALSIVELVDADERDPVLGQLRTQRALEAGAQPAAQPEHALADLGDRLRGREAVLAGSLDARVDLVVQARDADHVVLVEVGRVDRAELRPLEQRRRLVLGELQDAVVEVQPGQLAVDVQRRILELLVL